MLSVKFNKLTDEAKLPTRKHKMDAGIDVYSLETVRLAANSQKVIHTGIALAKCPRRYVLQVWPKSGLDAEFGLHTGAGIIDCEYRGEILILLKNMSEYIWEIEAGDAIAQLVLLPCPGYEIELTEDTDETERGDTGGITKTVTLNTKAEFKEE